MKDYNDSSRQDHNRKRKKISFITAAVVIPTDLLLFVIAKLQYKTSPLILQRDGNQHIMY